MPIKWQLPPVAPAVISIWRTRAMLRVVELAVSKVAPVMARVVSDSPVPLRLLPSAVTPVISIWRTRAMLRVVELAASKGAPVMARAVRGSPVPLRLLPSAARPAVSTWSPRVMTLAVRLARKPADVATAGVYLVTCPVLARSQVSRLWVRRVRRVLAPACPVGCT